MFDWLDLRSAQTKQLALLAHHRAPLRGKLGAVWCAEIYLPLVLKKKLRKRNCDLLTTGLKSDVLFGDFVDGDGVLG